MSTAIDYRVDAKGYVSLWVSTGDVAGAVEAALSAKYTDDGDWVPPAFAHAFGFNRFNPSTREARVLRSATDSVREAVRGFSYGELVGDRFAHACGETLPVVARSIVLLYEFKFSGSTQSAEVGGLTWRYVGCVPYSGPEQ